VRLPRVLLVLACASALVGAAAGCGSGGGTKYSGAKPDAWAATVCGALTDWAQGLQADSRTLSADLQSAKDISTVKAKFVVFLESASRSAGTMISKVKAAGPPAVKNGDQLQRDLEGGLSRAKQSFEKAVAKAKALPAKDPQAFSTGVTNLGHDVERELTATGEAFNTLGSKYKDKTLNEATSKEPSCSKLSSSSS
jgi:hypothetical protein